MATDDVFVIPVVLQREKHKLNPNRNQQINVRKVRTRKEEWERRKMGIEFMSDAKKMEQAGSLKEDKMPKGFVILFSSQPWLFVASLASSLTAACIGFPCSLQARLHACSLLKQLFAARGARDPFAPSLGLSRQSSRDFASL